VKKRELVESGCRRPLSGDPGCGRPALITDVLDGATFKDAMKVTGDEAAMQDEEVAA